MGLFGVYFMDEAAGTRRLACVPGDGFNEAAGIHHGLELSARLAWPTVLKMIRDTARGMAFLHSAKPSILHRDLKVGLSCLCPRCCVSGEVW